MMARLARIVVANTPCHVEPTLGLTGIPGAHIGAHVGAAVGAMNGLTQGAVLTGICYARFQYDN